MSFKTVEFKVCACGAKRGFCDENSAEKALGRARAKRSRMAEKAGTRRGMHVESRYYECPEGSFHLTSQSRRSFNEQNLVMA